MRREQPDLIVCDVIMPDMDGYKICEFVKNDPALGRTPVLLMSGIVNSTVLERAAQAGSNHVMRKPFAAEELLSRIESLLPGLSRSAAPGAAPTPPVAVPAAAAPAASTPVVPVTAERVASVPMPPRHEPAPEQPASPAMAPVTDPALDLKTALGALAANPGVSLAALIDREGALIEAAGGLLLDVELAAALASCLVESTAGVGRALAQGRLQSLILEYDACVVLLNSVGEAAMLAVVVADPAALGKVRYHVKKMIPDLRRAL
jgi:predicted regulator of Ras-like GTPase activity (Roadblock/LC7/MglB family)